MKKSLFFAAAASALMLTACSSENDVVQNTTPQTTVQQKAVGFDVYTPAATGVTRAGVDGLQGTMTTSRMQRSEADGGGFGVFAYLVEDADATLATATAYDPTAPGTPNFMWNEKILWNNVNLGWYYNPLKYWPNETNNDSQNTPATMEQYTDASTTNHLDRLSFFAYAPYVNTATPLDGSIPGIVAMTDKNGLFASSYSEPKLQYNAAMTNPNQAVDLLWGVAPTGGLTYTAVNGTTVEVKEGKPLVDMVKPNVNTSMKFLFQHALARFGITAVAAIDQVGAGGTLDPNTKITINEITITGPFGSYGYLNLDNSNANAANVANWVYSNGTTIDNSTTAIPDATITLSVANGAIADHLQFVGNHTTPSAQTDRVGVTTVRQNVIAPSLPGATTQLWSSGKEYAAGKLAYSESTPYYTDEACTNKATSLALNTATGQYYTLKEGVYTLAHAAGYAKTYSYPEVLSYYDVVFHCVTSDEVTAGTYATYTAYKWVDADTSGASNDGDYFTPLASTPAAGDYVITSSELKVPYYAAGTYYTRDANYFMVIPTNNVKTLNTSTLTSTLEKALRTITVKIEYYITTEDSKLAAGRAQTKNVVTKEVVLPSLANGKSYNLNLVLGLTSVKVEAEVDDWKVVNSQVDLPQNTAE